MEPQRKARACRLETPKIGRGDETVGNSHRAQISQFELFELILLLKLDTKFPVEQFEATVSQSTVPSPALTSVRPPEVFRRLAEGSSFGRSLSSSDLSTCSTAASQEASNRQGFQGYR